MVIYMLNWFIRTKRDNDNLKITVDLPGKGKDDVKLYAVGGKLKLEVDGFNYTLANLNIYDDINAKMENGQLTVNIMNVKKEIPIS